MDSAHLHLLLNHVPVIGTVFAIFLLLLGMVKKSDDVKKASMLVLIVTSLVTIPVYISGTNAEEIIEGVYEDVDENYIHEHEDMALYAFIAMNITGAAAILSMFLYRKPKELSNSFSFIMLIMLAIVLSLMGYTANLGAKIHHPEMRNGVAQTIEMNEEAERKDNSGKGSENSGKGSENKKHDEAEEEDED